MDYFLSPLKTCRFSLCLILRVIFVFFFLLPSEQHKYVTSSQVRRTQSNLKADMGRGCQHYRCAVPFDKETTTMMLFSNLAGKLVVIDRQLPPSLPPSGAVFSVLPVDLEKAINIPLLSRGFRFRLITWSILAATSPILQVR